MSNGQGKTGRKDRGGGWEVLNVSLRFLSPSTPHTYCNAIYFLSLASSLVSDLFVFLFLVFLSAVHYLLLLRPLIFDALSYALVFTQLVKQLPAHAVGNGGARILIQMAMGMWVRHPTHGFIVEVNSKSLGLGTGTRNMALQHGPTDDKSRNNNLRLILSSPIGIPA